MLEESNKNKAENSVENRKCCNQCGAIKSFGDFYKDARNADGITGQCKKCSLARMQRYYKKHPLRDRCMRIQMSWGKWVNVTEMENLFHDHPFCEYCKIPLTERQASIDHAVPPFRGGSPNALENLVVCCKDCNFLKGRRTADEFKVFLKEYIERFAVNTEPNRQKAEGVETMYCSSRPGEDIVRSAWQHAEMTRNESSSHHREVTTNDSVLQRTSQGEGAQHNS